MKDYYGILKNEVSHEIQKAIRTQFGKDFSIGHDMLEVPPLPEMGDCALPCFLLAKELKQSPIEIAQKLEDACAHGEYIEHVRALGPYLNIFFRPAALAKILFSSSSPSASGKKETCVMEYISPNTNKPLHLGHVRNAVLGESISRILEVLGYRVIRTSLVNDRGIHICKSMIAYEKKQQEKNTARRAWETPRSTGLKGDHFVGDYYVLFNEMLKKDESLLIDAQRCLQKWEKGDRTTRALWKKMNAWALRGLNQTYRRLGIQFDVVYFESELSIKGRDIVFEGVRKGIFKKDETGAVYADLTSYDLANKILLRRDGTSLYITQDMYLAVQKAKDFHASRSVYVIGSEQDVYMKQLFAILDMLHYPWAKKLHHVSYGMVCVPEGKMKSREGTQVDADALLDALEGLALKEVKNRGEKISQKNAQKKAACIARAALKFYLAEVGAKSDMIFRPEESIALTGRTGPYIQYTYARVKSILRKDACMSKKIRSHTHYVWTEEKQLLIVLSQFLCTIQSAADAYDPSFVARYTYVLAKTANEYYHSVQVLRAAPHERVARVLILRHVADILHKGLDILGIQTLEKM